MAAACGDGGFSKTPVGRLVLLFLGLVALTAAFQSGMERVERFLKQGNRRALRHVFRKLQGELLTLGFVSFCLIAAEEELLKICVDKGGDAEEHADEEPGACGYGRESFWNAVTINQAHVFLFILGTIQVFYACALMGLCLWRIESWRKWETGTQELLPLANPLAYNLSEMALLARGLVSQFSQSVTKPKYMGLRRLFIDRMGVPEDFDFPSFVAVCLEEDFSSIIALEWPMLALVTLWLAVPGVVFLPVSIVCLATLLLVGAKLDAVCTQLTQQTYDRYSAEMGVDTTGRSGSGCCTSVNVAEPDGAPPRLPRSSSRLSSEEVAQSTQKLFWGGRPKLMLRVFEFSVFENSLSITFLVFTLWQDPEYLSSSLAFGRVIVAGLVVLDLLVVLHSALYVLPVYALTSSVGTHCPTTTMERGKKHGLTAERALEAYQSGQAYSYNAHEGPDDVLSNESEEENQRSVTALLGAMYAKRLTLLRQEEHAAHLSPVPATPAAEPEARPSRLGMAPSSSSSQRPRGEPAAPAALSVEVPVAPPPAPPSPSPPPLDASQAEAAAAAFQAAHSALEIASAATISDSPRTSSELRRSMDRRRNTVCEVPGEGADPQGPTPRARSGSLFAPGAPPPMSLMAGGVHDSSHASLTDIFPSLAGEPASTAPDVASAVASPSAVPALVARQPSLAGSDSSAGGSQV